MVGPAILAALLMAAPAEDQPEPARTPVQEAIRLLKSCGLPNVRAHFDKKQGEQMLDGRAVGASSDEKLACAAQVSMGTGFPLRLKRSLQKRYLRIHDTLRQDMARAEGRNWLERHNLLSSLPEMQADKDAEFAAALEDLCGPAAKGALRSQYGPHAFNPDWLGSLVPDAAHVNALMCLTSAAAAASFELRFIGNEARKAGN